MNLSSLCNKHFLRRVLKQTKTSSLFNRQMTTIHSTPVLFQQQTKFETTEIPTISPTNTKEQTNNTHKSEPKKNTQSIKPSPKSNFHKNKYNPNHIDKHESITFTQHETRLINLIKGCLADPIFEGTVVRIAGGWIRDKLIGRETTDIDIVVNNMSASDFLNKLNEVLAKKSDKQLFGHVIAPKPESFKFYETVFIHFLSLDVDIICLKQIDQKKASPKKNEIYCTPKEDASRRDFTVNSLFFNINEMKIEDFTSLGRKDLKNQLIRTPISPLTTFSSDPVRILRAIRLASSLQFHISQDIFTVLLRQEENADLISKFAQNIHYQRTSMEFMKMLSPFPERSFYLLYKLRLFQHILHLPPDIYDSNQNLIQNYNIVHHVEHGLFATMIWKAMKDNYYEFRSNAEFSVLMPRLRALLYDSNDTNLHRSMIISLFHHKATNYYTDASCKISLFEHFSLSMFVIKKKEAKALFDSSKKIPMFLQLIEKIMEMPDLSPLHTVEKDADGSNHRCGPISRLDLGNVLYETQDEHVQLLTRAGIQYLMNKFARHAHLYELINVHRHYATRIESDPIHYSSSPRLKLSSEVLLVMKAMDEILRLITVFQLHEVWKKKPMIAGDEMVTLFPQFPRAKLFVLINEQKRWTLLNMNNENRDDLIKHLQTFVLKTKHTSSY